MELIKSVGREEVRVGDIGVMSGVEVWRILWRMGWGAGRDGRRDVRRYKLMEGATIGDVTWSGVGAPRENVLANAIFRRQKEQYVVVTTRSRDNRIAGTSAS